jgi:RNA polymerase sigma-70 factor (ECF subfamily)
MIVSCCSALPSRTGGRLTSCITPTTAAFLRSERQLHGADHEQFNEDSCYTDELGDSHDMRDWVAQGLQTLPIEQRIALELAYFMGHSCEEIAAITDCPVSTVKARMFHARERLRKTLPSLGGSPSMMAQ